MVGVRNIQYLSKTFVNFSVIFFLSIQIMGCDTNFQEPIIEQIANKTAQAKVSKNTQDVLEEKHDEHAHEHPISQLIEVTPEQNPVVSIPDFTPSSSEKTQTTPIHLDSPFVPLTSINQQSSSGGSSSPTGGGGGSSSETTETPQPNHFLSIDDIVLADSEESILSSSEGNAALIPNYDGKDLTIKIYGDFSQTAPSTTFEHMAFTNLDGLIHKSVVGNDEVPNVRVLLDDAMLWTPVEVKEDVLVMKLNSAYIPDLYLKGGSHKLTMIAGQLIAEKMIRVGEPESSALLSPIVDSLEIIRDEDGKPENLRLFGYNLMMAYRMSAILVNNSQVFGHQTSIVEDDGKVIWEKIVHLPEDFDESEGVSVTYISPFGASFYTHEETTGN